MKKYILFLVLVSNTSFAEIACDYSSFKHPDKEELSSLKGLHACELGVNFVKLFDIKLAMEECKKIYSLSSIDKSYTELGRTVAMFEDGDMEEVSYNYIEHRILIEEALNACLIGATRQKLLDSNSD